MNGINIHLLFHYLCEVYWGEKRDPLIFQDKQTIYLGK